MDPRRLRPGDHVAIVAPSSPYHLEDAKAAEDIMKAAGFVPRILNPSASNDPESITPAPIQERVEEFRAALADPKVGAIIAAQGGLGASELLQLIPYDEVADARKIIMGFSDTTALLNAVYARTGLTTFCGPVALIRTEPVEDTLADAVCLIDSLRLLSSGEMWGTKPFVRRQRPTVSIARGKAAGIAIGGNMTVLTTLLGTPFMPNMEGAILFLEDVDVGGGEMRRMLSHLDNAGAFDRCAGVVFGDFTNEPIVPGMPDVNTTIQDTFRGASFPVIRDANFSHGQTIACIPIGCPVGIDGTTGTIWFGNPVD